jgi:hypothetical protein
LPIIKKKLNRWPCLWLKSFQLSRRGHVKSLCKTKWQFK